MAAGVAAGVDACYVVPYQLADAMEAENRERWALPDAFVDQARELLGSANTTEHVV